MDVEAAQIKALAQSAFKPKPIENLEGVNLDELPYTDPESFQSLQNWESWDLMSAVKYIMSDSSGGKTIYLNDYVKDILLGKYDEKLREYFKENLDFSKVDIAHISDSQYGIPATTDRRAYRLNRLSKVANIFGGTYNRPTILENQPFDPYALAAENLEDPKNITSAQQIRAARRILKNRELHIEEAIKGVKEKIEDWSKEVSRQKSIDILGKSFSVLRNKDGEVILVSKEDVSKNDPEEWTYGDGTNIDQPDIFNNHPDRTDPRTIAWWNSNTDPTTVETLFGGRKGRKGTISSTGVPGVVPVGTPLGK